MGRDVRKGCGDTLADL